MNPPITKAGKPCLPCIAGILVALGLVSVITVVVLIWVFDFNLLDWME